MTTVFNTHWAVRVHEASSDFGRPKMYGKMSEVKGKTKLAITSPSLVGRVVNRTLHRSVKRWNYSEKGLDFVDADWDNLIILDACRYDLFAEHHTLPGVLEKRQSRASSTVGFLRTNVLGKDLTDTVYITANGQIYNFRDEVDPNFHAIIPLYADAWDDALRTVPPNPVTEAAIDARNQYPHKRLLVHYVQPHFPFIGAESVADRFRVGDGQRPFWLRVFQGEVDLSAAELWESYKQTFELVLPEVERLMTSLDGRTVVTSDHGNMFGERAHPIPIREWGHPDGIYTRQLVEVPWLVYESGQRPEIRRDPPKETSLRADPAVVADQLEALGYV